MDLSDDNLTVKVLTTADNAGLESTEAELGTLQGSAVATSATFDSFNKTLGKVGDTATATGKSLSTYVTLPIVAIGGESVKMAMNFQQSMEMLHTNAGVAQSDIAGLSTAILNMAGEVGQGPEALATAMYHIASAGNGIWTTAQQLNVLKIAAEGAAVGQADLDDTTYALTSTLAANVIGATDASDTMGTLLAIVGSGDMKLSDLNAAIGTGLMGTLSSFGVSLQSAGAALADLGDNGEQGAAAANRLRMMLTLMASPTQAAAQVLGDLGLDAEQAGTATDDMNTIFEETGLSTTKLATDLQQPNGISVALTDLKSHLEAAGLSATETDTVLTKAFGGGKSDAALLQLLDTTDRLNTKFASINQSAGDFADNVATQQETAAQQFHDAWAGVQADMIKLGNEVLPEVAADFQKFGQYVNDVSNWFNGLNDTQKQFVIHAAEVAAAVGPVLLIFGKLASSLSAIGTLSSSVAKGLGLLKFADLGAGAGEATEAIAGGGGLIAALAAAAPEIIAVGVAAGGAYLLWKKFEDEGKSSADTLNTQVDPAIQNYTKLSKDLGVTIQQTSGAVSMLALAQKQVADDKNLVTAASADVQTAYQKQAAQAAIAQQYTASVATAQAAVTAALNKYGQDSPQYEKATANLSAAQSALNAQLALSISNSLTLTIRTGELGEAQNDLKKDALDLGNAEQWVNGNFMAGQDIVAQFGADVLGAAVNGVQVMTGSIIGMQIAWDGAASDISQTGPAMEGILQNASFGITQLQGQADALNKTLMGSNYSGSAISAAAGGLQGVAANVVAASGKNQIISGNSNAGTGITLSGHFASGTNYARGGTTLVGEYGPEVIDLPTGSQVKTATQTKNSKSSNSGGNHFYGDIILGTAGAATQFFKNLNNDSILASKGLTVRQGR